jgi:histone acetyltransferase SAS3
MAAAVLMEEELQHSMATSEEDAEFEEDDELAADTLGENSDEFAANNQLHNGMLAQSEDEAGEDDEMLSDEDAEGEEDDEMADSGPNNEEDSEEEEDEDEDGEGVGAVKIQPGGLVDDDEEALSGTDDEEEASAVSGEDDDESKDSTDAEVEVEWDPTAEDEEEEPANPNRCMYVSFECLTCAFIDNIPDSVNRTKRTTPVRNLSSILPVVFVEIMVCLPGKLLLTRLTRL